MAKRLNRVQQVERNRALLLDAARRVFLTKGYNAATLEAIADEAGFSKGAIYSQFDSKADLFLALLDRRITERAAENERAAAGLAGRAGIAALLRSAERDAAAEPGWAALLVEFRAHAARDPALNRRYAQAHARTIDRLAAVLTQLHERAGLEPAMPPRTMAALILAFGSGVVLERIADPQALPTPLLMGMLVRAVGLPGDG